MCVKDRSGWQVVEGRGVGVDMQSLGEDRRTTGDKNC